MSQTSAKRHHVLPGAILDRCEGIGNGLRGPTVLLLRRSTNTTIEIASMLQRGTQSLFSAEVGRYTCKSG